MRPFKITGAFNHLQQKILEWETHWFRSLFSTDITKTFIDPEEKLICFNIIMCNFLEIIE